MNEKKILIIDDNVDVTASLTMILRSEGYLPTAANSGVAGLVKMVEIVPDLVILDLMLPDIKGWALLKRMASDPKTAQIPVIILTGYSDVDEPLEFGQQKVAVVVKASPTDELLAKVREMLPS